MGPIKELSNFVPYDDLPKDFEMKKGTRVIYYYENEHYETNIDDNPLWSEYSGKCSLESLIGKTTRTTSPHSEHTVIEVAWSENNNDYFPKDLLFEVSKTKTKVAKVKEI